MGMNDWKEIFDVYNTQKLISGKILKKNPGGVTVDVMGQNGFLPWSQIPPRLKSDPESITEHSVDFSILKLNAFGNNIVVSRQAVLQKEKEEQHLESLKKIEIGGIYDGVVKNVVDYGAFVTIEGSIDGLIPSKDLSWRFFENINDVVKVGDPIKVKVIKINQENHKISLSHKACEPSPWETIDETIYYKDAIIKVSVIKMGEYGLLVSLPNGCQGILDKNEITWEDDNPDIEKLFKINQQLEVKIRSINKNKGQLHVSLKRLTNKPADYIRPGIRLVCTIDHEDKDGLYLSTSKKMPVYLPFSEISWIKKYDIKDYIKNNKVQVVIIANHVGGHQNIGSIRHMYKDPMSEYAKGTFHKGVISGETYKVYFVNFKDGLTGIIPKKSLGNITLSRNQTVNTCVVEADKETRHLILDYSLESEFTGNDIMNMLNLRPGREVGLLKRHLKDAIIDGVIDTSYSAGENFVKQKAAELGII